MVTSEPGAALAVVTASVPTNTAASLTATLRPPTATPKPPSTTSKEMLTASSLAAATSVSPTAMPRSPTATVANTVEAPAKVAGARILFDESHAEKGSIKQVLAAHPWNRGDLADLLRTNGFEVQRHATGEITSSVLNEYDAFVILLPMGAHISSCWAGTTSEGVPTFTEKEISALRSFVDQEAACFLPAWWGGIRCCRPT